MNLYPVTSHDAVDLPGDAFVIHAIRSGAWRGRISAWYDSAGNVLDAEQIVEQTSRRGVKYGASRRSVKYGPIWQALGKIGRHERIARDHTND